MYLDRSQSGPRIILVANRAPTIFLLFQKSSFFCRTSTILFFSPYRDSCLETPNIQRMAGRGALYRSAYCPSSLCLPCRAAFSAGRYVHETQAYNDSNVNLPTNFETWGRVLGQQGIHSVMVGKVDAYAPSATLGYSEEIVTGDRAFPGDTNISRKPMAIRSTIGSVSARRLFHRKRD